jgi:hypothetical protein
MTRSSDIKKQIQQQDAQVYGDESVSGSSIDTEQVLEETTAEMVEDVIGNKPAVGKGFNIGDEINEDEEDL